MLDNVAAPTLTSSTANEGPAVDAVIYCRISHDATGEAAGVARQESECRALARRLGLDVAAVLVDNDLSAYSGVRRPAYLRLLERISDGAVRAVIAWHPDRLHRSLKELEEFISVIDAQRVAVHTVTAGDVDLSTPVGRMIARQLGTFARYESEHKSERIISAHRAKAHKGEWHGSNAPYGYAYARDAVGTPIRGATLEVLHEQAQVIKEAAGRFLSGENVPSIIRDLNERGVPSPRGGQWTVATMRSILVSPTSAGLRDYHGEVVAKGRWPAILNEDDHDALRARLTDNRRTKGIRAAKLYLLIGGLSECGLCGYRLYTARRPEGTRYYRCPSARGGCGRIHVVMTPLDNHVTDRLFAHLGHANVSKLVANPHAFRRELDRRSEIDGYLKDLAGMYATRTISRVEWQHARAGLAQQLRTLPEDPSHLGGLELGDANRLRIEWDALHIDRRRALLQLVIDVVVVHPARRGPRLRPERAEIRWR